MGLLTERGSPPLEEAPLQPGRTLRHHELLRNLAIAVIVLWSLSLFFSCAHAATITIVHLDGAGELRSAAFQHGHTVVVVR